MKRYLLILSALLFVALSSCDNPEKSRNALDEGIKLMYTYAKHAEAEEAFTKAIKYDGNNWEAYYYRGCTKFNLQRYKEAIADFEKSLELKPNNSDAYFAMGRIYFIMNDLEMACYYYNLAADNGRPNMEDYLKFCR